ncbi:hypothetical protein P3T29_006276 [Kitasatospora sp. MAP5-34]|nr:hypothetical protein [Kitasatospora sp. MAP5-34]
MTFRESSVEKYSCCPRLESMARSLPSRQNTVVPALSSAG